MEGHCPECNRAYDISEEFLAMGGKAKCPHCLLELEFTQHPRSQTRDEARFRESTKPDPRRQMTSAQDEVVELDSHCDSCGRHFKVDSEYLKAAGNAQCPHCGVDLVFDEELPESSAAQVDAGDDLESQAPGGELDIGIDDDQEEQPDVDDEAWDSQGQDADAAPDDGGDLWAATTELNLPELDDLRAEASGEAPAVEGEEEIEEQVDSDLDQPAQFESEPTVEISQALEARAAADFDSQLEAESGLDEQAGEPFAEDEDAWQAPDENVIVGKLESEGEGQDEAFEPEGLPDEPQPEWDESSAEEPVTDAPPEGLDAEEQPQEQVDEDEFESGLPGLSELGLAEAAPEGAGQELAEEEYGDSWPEDSEEEVSLETESGSDESAAQADGEAPADEVPEAAGAAGDQKPEDSGVFAGLATSEDWASAAARWAESGFKPDAIPSFIQESDRAAGAEEDQPAEQQEPESGSQVLLAQQAEQAVEVSDADIMMLEEDEAEIVEPAAGRPESWAQRASRELAAKPAKAMAPKPSTRFSRIRSTPILAGAIGLIVVIVGGLIWVMMSGDKNIDKIAFPAKGLKVNVVKAPGPSNYKAKPAAVEHYGLGNRLAYHGKLEDAIIEYKQAAHLDHGYPHPYRAMGAIYAALGKRRLSDDAYQTYLRLSPHAPDRKQVKKIIAHDNGD